MKQPQTFNRRRAIFAGIGGLVTTTMIRTIPALGLMPLTGLLASTRQFESPLLGREISVPIDHGVHPNYRNEWWYFTGWFTDENSGKELGLQITFFRTAPDIPTNSPSRFNPSQILLAHAAIANPENGKLIHDQIIRRVDGLDTLMQSASQNNSDRILDLSMPGWSLTTQDGLNWQCQIETSTLTMALEMSQTQAPWAQGNNGYSRKGPEAGQSSHYLTLPHMQCTGLIKSQDANLNVRGKFWMDHEWFSSYLDDRAQGWDWVGLHGNDGSALMAFQIRSKQVDAAPLWRYGAIRSADGKIRFYKNIRFETIRQWTSLDTNTTYPVEQNLIMDEEVFHLSPLFDNQELDSRATSGTIYWEGAMSIRRNSQPWGNGYMELTGYNEALGI